MKYSRCKIAKSSKNIKIIIKNKYEISSKLNSSRIYFKESKRKKFNVLLNVELLMLIKKLIFILLLINRYEKAQEMYTHIHTNISRVVKESEINQFTEFTFLIIN